MFQRACVTLCLSLLIAFLSSSAQQPPTDAHSPAAAQIPDTPAGHTFKAWFDAFNSGDRAVEEKYLQTYDPGKSLDDEMRFRAMTGGFVLLQILKSDLVRLEFMVKDHSGGTIAIGKMEVKSGEPAQVASFSIRAVSRACAVGSTRRSPFNRASSPAGMTSAPPTATGGRGERRRSWSSS